MKTKQLIICMLLAGIMMSLSFGETVSAASKKASTIHAESKVLNVEPIMCQRERQTVRKRLIFKSQ